MDREGVKRYFLNFYERNLPSVVEREISLEDSSKIQTVIGPRRAGKSYLFFQKIISLMKSDVRKSQILYLNFEHPALNDITYKEFGRLLEIYWEIFPSEIGQRLYIFIDEPQVMPKWEIAIRGLYDEFRYPIFITGSSSRLLSREIATNLRGRSLATLLLPLSFGEFLRFKGLGISPERLSTSSKSKLLSSFSEFLKLGGYPEVVLEPNESKKVQIIKDYFDLVIYRDIIERYSIQKIELIKWLISSLARSAAKEFSLNKLYLTLKSEGRQVGKDTLYDYFGILEDCFFAMPIRKFDPSIKRGALSVPKIYLVDTGFFELFSAEDYGKRLENAVFIELKRQQAVNPLIRANYWKSKDGKEVDFVISKADKVISAIQVCYQLKGSEAESREIGSLVSCLEAFGLKEGTVITYDEIGEIKVPGKVINIIPAWKWLLKEGIL